MKCWKCGIDDDLAWLSKDGTRGLCVKCALGATIVITDLKDTEWQLTAEKAEVTRLTQLLNDTRNLIKLNDNKSLNEMMILTKLKREQTVPKPDPVPRQLELVTITADGITREPIPTTVPSPWRCPTCGGDEFWIDRDSTPVNFIKHCAMCNPFDRAKGTPQKQKGDGSNK